jgi:hypothetical protein
MFAKSDNLGNDLYMRIFFNEKGEEVGATISLKLKSENKRRVLGNFYFHDRSFHVMRETSKHLFHKGNAYGFNWSILSDTTLNIQKVYLVVDRQERYIIPISYIRDYGRFLNFKDDQHGGFELQRFMNMDLIKRFRDDNYMPKTNSDKESDDNLPEHE